MARIVKKATERRADIIHAARSLFLSKEYEKTTMQDVMESLGIAKGTIYHYFDSKEELLEAVVEDMVDQSFKEMQALLKQMKGNALEKIQTLVEAGRIAKDNKPILEQLHKSGNEALHLRLLAETLAKQAPLYASLIQQGCEEGIFKTDAPLECAELILSGIQFMTDTGIYPWQPEDLARRINAFPRLIEQLLQAPTNAFQFLFKL
jgi:AcrR family transcriptional regulator